MAINFINRKIELEHLRELKKLTPSPFVVIVGRRRVGKTRLVREFLDTVESSAYFFVEEKKPHVLLNDLSRIAGEGVVFRDWEGFIRHVLASFDVVVIDEFQNFERVDPSFFSTLQKVVDEEDSHAMLITVGSYVGMMKKIFQDRKSPLFGRATEIWTLPPLPMKDIIPVIKGTDENRISIYSMFGGYPKYHVVLQQYQVYDVEQVVEKLVIRNYAPLSMEPYNLLLLEFGGEYRAYFSLLEAIAKGKCSYVDIANYTAISSTTLARYLKDLLAYGVIEKRFPVTEGINSKKTRYFISDQFIRFWFRFIFPNMNLVEAEKHDELMNIVRKELPLFVSWEFEQIVRSVVKSIYPRSGSWWNRKGEEMDVVGIDDDRRRILFGEVKWSNRKIGWGIVKALMEKSALVHGFKNYEKKYLFVSKSGFSTYCITQMEKDGNIHHWDLSDIMAILGGKRESDL